MFHVPHTIHLMYGYLVTSNTNISKFNFERNNCVFRHLLVLRVWKKKLISKKISKRRTRVYGIFELFPKINFQNADNKETAGIFSHGWIYYRITNNIQSYCAKFCLSTFIMDFEGLENFIFPSNFTPSKLFCLPTVGVIIANKSKFWSKNSEQGHNRKFYKVY